MRGLIVERVAQGLIFARLGTLAESQTKGGLRQPALQHRPKKMPNYTFRVRFLRSPTDTLNIDAARWEWHPGKSTPALLLCSHNQQESIEKSKQLVLKSEGWPSPEGAAVAAAKYTDALALSLARLRIGADFGSRAPKSVVTEAGLAMLEAQTGHRYLNDVHGLLLYESEPPPRFASSRLDVVRGVPKDRFERVFSYAVEHPRELSDHERLSLDLFNASYFQNSADSRFLMLMMAVEALLIPALRSPAATAHVDALKRMTRESDKLSTQEKGSLLGSLTWLLRESINQTGRRLAEERLGSRTYTDMKPPAFFSYCYDLRSRLVHGNPPFPTQQEIGSAVGQLEVFVSDLLAGELLGVQL